MLCAGLVFLLCVRASQSALFKRPLTAPAPALLSWYISVSPRPGARRSNIGP